jgi:hypothetical protein
MMAGNVTRTTSRLADGRELLYFDDEPGTDRGTVASAATASKQRDCRYENPPPPPSPCPRNAVRLRWLPLSTRR